MANGMLIKALFLLSIILLTSSTGDQILCSKNSTTLLETTGDAILTVFVDANHGQYCNISSSKGLQQISTALHVVRTLNKYNHVPDVKLGLRILDTCHDGIIVFKQALRATLERNCAPDYEMGVLVPSRYNPIVNVLRDHGGLPIGTYRERNFTVSTIDILAHYLSTRYKVVDLIHAKMDFVLDRFLMDTRNAGVCVRQVNDDGNANVTEAVIVAIGERNDIQRWLEESAELEGSEKTWLLLPLDNSDIDDFVPSGSYIIKPETPDFDLGEFSSVDKFLENSGDSANRSPYLLDIGKAIVGLAEVLQDVRRRCPTNNHDNDNNDDNDEKNCVVNQFGSQSPREIRDSDVYKALHMQPSSHSIRYAVVMKAQHELVDVALYGIEVSNLRVLLVTTASGMPGLCLGNLVGNCENCTNFQEHSEAHVVTKADVIGRSALKKSIYVPIFLVAIVCGTLACCVTAIFIIYRFATEETLDGNPILTIILVLSNMFTLLTALPFCMMDDYFGAEDLNARKIFLTTLAFGFTFTIMLSRALFLALSTSDIFITHINGYLQSLMAFFMSGIQVAMSVMYFVLSTVDSAVIARSSIFIALLGYVIFLLIALFVTSCFIVQIQRNYHEGKCFFSTAIGLLVIWATWLICFILMQPENRDTVVSFGIIGTAYLIIFGVLIPRIYYMITHPPRRKSIEQRFDPIDLPTDSIVNTIVRQPRSTYDYVQPTRENQILRVPSTYTNYYSGSSPSLDRCRSPNYREMPIYSNYGFQAEMKEIDADHVMPRVCVESIEFLRNPKVIPNDVIYAQPRIYKSQRIVLEKKNNAETIRIRDGCSPTSKLHDEMYPMRYSSPTNMAREERIDEEDEDENEQDEEDHENEGVSRVTRF